MSFYFKLIIKGFKAGAHITMELSNVIPHFICSADLVNGHEWMALSCRYSHVGEDILKCRTTVGKNGKTNSHHDENRSSTNCSHICFVGQIVSICQLVHGNVITYQIERDKNRKAAYVTFICILQKEFFRDNLFVVFMNFREMAVCLICSICQNDIVLKFYQRIKS